ncbi:halocyanin domain-containing protein [Halarchaeum sp. P4]|uniref:halocyanin domain-containing protein n=1 Tax=Halarchaeum sp. P4 TaxID=3421639 RepID=UPI003EB9A44A
MTVDRRTLLRRGGTAVLGAVGLAGCFETDSPDADPVAEEPDYGGWFARSEGYSRTLDYTGQGQVNVEVGVPGNGGEFAFAPPAIAVSPHTTVVWQWTGEGGQHDVVAADDSFRSPYHSEAGATYSHTFDDTGVHRYFCAAHRSEGMRGAVVVTDE